MLQFAEPDGAFIESLDDLGVFTGVGEQGGGGLGVHQQGGQLGGGDLEADFGELLGIVLAEVIGEVVLEVSQAELVVLLGAPFLVAAASAPVGDIAFGDGDAELGEGPDDFAVGDVVVEELVDHIALEFGQASDFAVAEALREERAGGGRSGDDVRAKAGGRRRGLGYSRLDSPALDESALLFDTEGAVAEEVLQVSGGRALGDRLGVDNGEGVVVGRLGAGIDRG